ncbi:response regulator [Methylobacterium nigriterrae]|uniref:response regulator n=1 Tax=Methylobacterium nigriterrae TaxID=3127512 RepID=UPI00301402A3
MADRPTSLADRRVLVVEDEYVIAMDIGRCLQEAGAVVAGPVPDAEQALALIEAAPLDAAVLDVNLRGEPVYVVADRLKERGVPYLFATGESQIADRSDYRSRPKLEKPILGTELVRAVGKLMSS